MQKFLSYFIFILFPILSAVAFAQSELIIRDSSLSRGKSYVIPVLLKQFDTQENGDLGVAFNFDANLLEIHSAIANENTKIKPNQFQFNKNINLADLQNSSLVIIANGLTNNSDTLIYLEIEALAGNDSIAYLSPNRLTYNQEDFGDRVNFVEGKFSIGQPIGTVLNEGIGENYPNPFEYNTSVPFFIAQPTEVSFQLFAMSGARLSRVGEFGTLFDYEIIDNLGQKAESILAPGAYTLKLSANVQLLSSGKYFLSMTTIGGNYITNIIYQK